MTGSSNPETTHLVHLACEASPAAEKIFLLGSTQMQRRTHTIFHNSQPTCRYTGQYYVLVLVNDTGTSALHGIRDAIEARSRHWIPVTAIVLHTQTFTDWLFEGHLFAQWVTEQSTLIYDATGEPLPPATPCNEEKLESADKKLLADTKQKVQSFLAGAELYRLRKEYRMAAFMLHQAAEQQLRAMLTINTGLRVNTHNLERLTRYNCMWCDRLMELFPKNNEALQRLFGLLQRAYTGARYDMAYAISGADLGALERKVTRMVEILGSA